MNKEVLSKSYELVFLMLICITILLYFRSSNNGLNNKVLLSLQMAAFVTCIASFHYYYMLYSKSSPVSYRYFDWFFTTPILLLDLCLLLDIFDIKLIKQVVILNTLMLLIGYLGEMGVLSMNTSTILGFIPFGMIFYMIYSRYTNKHRENKTLPDKIRNDNILYYSFVSLWSLYGINHLVPFMDIKNINYNILDLITKGVFGLFVYYSSFS